jgi:hypothetical protein
MNENELLWGYYLEQRVSAKAFDDQRTSIANFVITAAGVLIGFAATLGFSHATIIVYGFVALLGGYGMAATRKLYECSSFCMRRASDSLSRISHDQPLPFAEMKEAALAEQQKQFRVMSRVRLHLVWMVLHGLILLFGFTGMCVSILRSNMG